MMPLFVGPGARHRAVQLWPHALLGLHRRLGPAARTSTSWCSAWRGSSPSSWGLPRQRRIPRPRPQRRLRRSRDAGRCGNLPSGAVRRPAAAPRDRPVEATLSNHCTPTIRRVEGPRRVGSTPVDAPPARGDLQRAVGESQAEAGEVHVRVVGGRGRALAEIGGGIDADVVIARDDRVAVGFVHVHGAVRVDGAVDHQAVAVLDLNLITGLADGEVRPP